MTMGTLDPVPNNKLDVLLAVSLDYVTKIWTLKQLQGLWDRAFVFQVKTIVFTRDFLWHLVD